MKREKGEVFREKEKTREREKERGGSKERKKETFRRASRGIGSNGSGRSVPLSLSLSLWRWLARQPVHVLHVLRSRSSRAGSPKLPRARTSYQSTSGHPPARIDEEALEPCAHADNRAVKERQREREREKNRCSDMRPLRAPEDGPL